MVVKGRAGQGGDEDAKLGRLGDLIRQHGIQGMDAFKQQHTAFLELQFLAVVFALARDEVVFRHLDLLTSQQGNQVTLQGGMVHGVEVVEIIFAVRQLGCILAVDEIVVRGERDGLQAAGLQLDADTAAEGGLATAARPCDEHQAHGVLAMIAAVDFFGNLYDFLLLQGLCHLHQFPRHPVFAGMVDVADRTQAHDIVPLQAFRKHLKGLGLVFHLCQAVGVVAVGNTDQDTVAIGFDIPDVEVAR